MEALSDRTSRLQPRTICIVKPSSMGDIVHSLPILPALRQLFPVARISWVVNSPFRSLLDGNPHLDQVIAFERGGWHLSPRGALDTAQVLGRLYKQKYDLTIDLQGLLRSGLMTAASRAPVRVGMADAREAARLCYTHRVDAPRLKLHAVDRVRRVVDQVCADLDQVAHVEIDLDANPAAARRFSVLSLPTTLIFDVEGRQRYRASGVPTAADLRSALQPLLA